MISVVSLVSAALQLFYVTNLFVGLYSVMLVFRDDSLVSGGDPKMLDGAISQSLMTIVIGAVVGLVGAALAWYILRDKKSRPDWFVSASRTFAFAWMMFIPIGTTVGFFMLRWRKPAGETQEVT